MYENDFYISFQNIVNGMNSVSGVLALKHVMGESKHEPEPSKKKQNMAEVLAMVLKLRGNLVMKFAVQVHMNNYCHFLF